LKEIIFLLLGSNIGNSSDFLYTAIEHISEKLGLVSKFSSVYKTKAWGNTDQDDYLNQVILVETEISPQMCLKEILNIESKMGRVRTEKWQPRTIDIDILFYGSHIIKTPGLEIPHPLIHKRLFALAPMNEIAGDFIHPVYEKNISTLLSECDDELKVEKM